MEVLDTFLSEGREYLLVLAVAATGQRALKHFMAYDYLSINHFSRLGVLVSQVFSIEVSTDRRVLKIRHKIKNIHS